MSFKRDRHQAAGWSLSDAIKTIRSLHNALEKCRRTPRIRIGTPTSSSHHQKYSPASPNLVKPSQKYPSTSSNILKPSSKIPSHDLTSHFPSCRMIKTELSPRF